MRLYRITKELFILNYKDRKALMLNGIEEVFETARVLEISPQEVEFALLSMTKNDHNYAEFGVFNGFVMSERI